MNRKKIRQTLQKFAGKFLEYQNISSIGIGEDDGKECLIFTVDKKEEKAEKIGDFKEFKTKDHKVTIKIPRELKVGDAAVATDVRELKPTIAQKDKKSKTKLDNKEEAANTISPGTGIVGKNGELGTIGAIVFDAVSKTPLALSCWHVLDGTLSGKKASPTFKVKEGASFIAEKANRKEKNYLGDLYQSYVGPYGDCAVTKIENKEYLREVEGLNFFPTKTKRAEIGDIVVKMGFSTKITFGMVSRTEVVSKINYGSKIGNKIVTGFEIDPLNDSDEEISMSGDSGAAWLLVEPLKENVNPTDQDSFRLTKTAVGLHLGGDQDNNKKVEYAFACHMDDVLKVLNVRLLLPEDLEKGTIANELKRRAGLNITFPGKDRYNFAEPEKSFSLDELLGRDIARNMAGLSSKTIVPQGIYGEDDRKDVFHLERKNEAGETSPGEQKVIENAKAVVIIVHKKYLEKIEGSAFYQIRTTTLNRKIEYQYKVPLALTEPFREQLRVPCSTGFLITPNTIITAGHALKPKKWEPRVNLEDYFFVVGFKMKDELLAETLIHKSQVFKGEKIEELKFTSKKDWAVVNLEKEVENIKPLKLGNFNPPDEENKANKLYILGHPTGLPIKYAPNAEVLKNGSTYFRANLDAYGGNSGSPVFDEATNQVVGILVRGAVDYIRLGGFMISNPLPNTGVAGEKCQKIDHLKKLENYKYFWDNQPEDDGKDLKREDEKNKVCDSSERIDSVPEEITNRK
ncbi:MAG: serine protease [Flammeovirgaceae bacterium]|nr:serine protease [Flammeovirgaceae bacterium]